MKTTTTVSKSQDNLTFKSPNAMSPQAGQSSAVPFKRTRSRKAVVKK